MHTPQPVAWEDALIRDTAAWVRQRMAAEGSHDWHHVQRVWRVVRELRQAEADRGRRADRLVVELAALLHDIADAKFHGGDESLGPRLAREWLESGDHGGAGLLSPERLAAVPAIIASMSYRHKNALPPEPWQLEYALVRDADRLDALGAIGIARAFAYGGLKGRALWDGIEGPDADQSSHVSGFAGPPESASPEPGLTASTQATAARQTSLGHFYDKLFKLKDLMLTESGRAQAQERHDFLLLFERQFRKEWGETDRE